MTLKLLQLNIWKGKLLPEIIEYVKTNDFDILHFQEVSNGEMSGARNQYPDETIQDKDSNEVSGVDCFEEIKKIGYEGKLVPVFAFEDDPNSYQGVATFYKKKFQLLKDDIIWMKEFSTVPRVFHEWQRVGRAAISLKLSIDNKTFYSINTHMAWGPTAFDEDFKITQAKILYDYTKNIQEPFVFSGDFNVIPETKTASMFNDFGRNLTAEDNITNTLNVETHPVKQLFPKGLAVDYVFVSPEIDVKDFQMIEKPNLSDHYGLKLEFEL